MGFYSQNRFSSVNDITVEEATGYEGVVGAGVALLESYQNDYKLFEGTLMCDFQEASAIAEGASEDSIFALQENFVTSMWEKIKDFFKKLWAKIKSIFHSFIAKFDSIVMKSNKEFFKKYYREVMTKDLKDMKAKYSKHKTLPNTSSTIIITGGAGNNTEDALKKEIEDFDRDDQFEKYAKDLTGLDLTEKDFSKDFHEALFEDEEEEEGLDEIVRECGAVLQNGDKALKFVKTMQSKMDRAIGDIIKDIEKDESKSLKNYPTESGKEDQTDDDLRIKTYGVHTDSDASGHAVALKGTRTATSGTTPKYYQSYLRLIHMRANVAQAVITKTTSSTITEAKFSIAQARRIFAKAVAYNDKTTKAESADLFAEAFAEAEEYDVLTDME